ncbi:aromatic ring-hydroxylating dioxygenase subunit alpha [Xanthomonas hyacinthi]|uniref:2Fe-2S ferredoxin n=1 Tax=Xanthomonas hyacinthi TaxID=56455 RepID=A0A2S7EVL5_9XANT|nr:aromatic ring-hydroxylating dioxygenase subunit alpha [Xanthomonas hyacinthi]PPU97157.1 2Fe-2S ferredoxin [Xanthomonas hyacinthi]QGY78669.1 aromatic ring-hydroxylating dioxygenase subunit alpha [Xanthomonas hyacinthi]
MTRHALDAEHYISEHSLRLEQARLFGKLWNFVGFSSMVRERNQFFARQVAGVPVLVQRTDAGIRAFLNQCPHRQSAIQIERQGKRPLVCPYHAWSFGAEGELRGLPNSGLYQFSAEEKAGICLTQFRLEQIGQLLFVNFSDDPLPLQEQFSPEFLEDIRAASMHLDSQIIYSCHRVRYNWKLNMENVKDYNHVPFVHPKTFSPLMADAPKPSGNVERPADVPSEVQQLLQVPAHPALSELSFSVKGAITPQVNWFRDLCEAYGEDSAYYNWFIYPNVNFCSVRGDYFLLQQYDPVSAHETDYHLWVMTARRKSERTDFTALLSNLIRGERIVIAEDTVLLERMQAGFGAHSPRFMHGDYETQLVRQHLWYRANVLGELA